MSHAPARGTTSHRMGARARPTTTGPRVASPMVRAALGEGQELIRERIAESHRRRGVADPRDDTRADDLSWDLPRPDE